MLPPLNVRANLSTQTKLTASEEQLDAAIDTLYVDIENTTMPARLQQKLLNKVTATNHSIQVLYGVSLFCLSAFSYQLTMSRAVPRL